MANGIPVRLSADLTVRARAAAGVLDRSLTEQVEHWARLGQAVEGAVLSATVERLKARSFDLDLNDRLALASTTEGRSRAAKVIRDRNPVRHGAGPNGTILTVRDAKRRSKRA